MPLSTSPYKGTRDFYPEDKRIQKYLFKTWSKVLESYGYEEYDAPILESLDLYLAKSGEEIVNEQTYLFTDRGGREVVIRPEMTPSVSRLVAGKRQELVYPLRWYSIPNLWRYERPQRGRLREHWQLNVDLFGVQGISAELEMVKVIDDIFKAFGANENMYQIRLNHRGLTNFILSEYVGLNEGSQHKVLKLIDRMHKLETTKFLTQLDDSLEASEKESGANEKLMSLLSETNLNNLPDELLKSDAYIELKSLLSQAKASGIKNVIYDPTIMRGFDYYTGIVFEVVDLDPENNRSMLGGGRYDGLVGLFGVKPVPTVGFGWGDVTLENFLKSHDLLPSLKPETELSVALIGDVFARAQIVLSNLREAGINTTVDISGKKLGDQLKNAEKKGLNKVLVIGEDELNSGTYKLKYLEDSREEEADLSQIIKLVKGN
jgi:histidyl-tRNA synthetase